MYTKLPITGGIYSSNTDSNNLSWNILLNKLALIDCVPLDPGVHLPTVFCIYGTWT